MTYRQVINGEWFPSPTTTASVSDDIPRACDRSRNRQARAALHGAKRVSRTVAFESALVPKAEARSQLGLSPDRVIIGVVGRLFPLKGHEEVLDAAPDLVRHHPDAQFAFVGSGPLEPQLRKIVDERGLKDHVAFVGRLPPEAMPVMFSAFDILAHASRREGLARVIPQGVLARVPVVCYDLDGSRGGRR